MFNSQVMELMVRDMGQLTHIECSVKRQKWANVLQALKLTPEQREQLMGNRKEHLNKLRRIFQDRQELNVQVQTPCTMPKAQHHIQQANVHVDGLATGSS